MADPRPNLFTHEVIKTIQVLALPEFQGETGFPRVLGVLDSALRPLGTDVARARVSEYRKLYHAGWDRVVAEVSPREYRDLLTDRFKSLVF